MYTDIKCQDCLTKARVTFHVLGMKCPKCGGYNTVKEQEQYFRKTGEDSCMFANQFDPLGRPTATTVSDHYCHKCRPQSKFSKSRKTKQISSENSHRYV